MTTTGSPSGCSTDAPHEPSCAREGLPTSGVAGSRVWGAAARACVRVQVQGGDPVVARGAGVPRCPPARQAGLPVQGGVHAARAVQPPAHHRHVRLLHLHARWPQGQALTTLAQRRAAWVLALELEQVEERSRLTSSTNYLTARWSLSCRSCLMKGGQSMHQQPSSLAALIGAPKECPDTLAALACVSS